MQERFIEVHPVVPHSAHEYVPTYDSKWTSTASHFHVQTAHVPSGVHIPEDILKTGDAHTSVVLRGIPFCATVAHVTAFLGPHIRHARDNTSVHLIMNRSGKFSGLVRIDFVSKEAAQRVRQDSM